MPRHRPVSVGPPRQPPEILTGRDWAGPRMPIPLSHPIVSREPSRSGPSHSMHPLSSFLFAENDYTHISYFINPNETNNMFIFIRKM
jgi:hypothetical protein